MNPVVKSEIALLKYFPIHMSVLEVVIRIVVGRAFSLVPAAPKPEPPFTQG